MHPISECVDLSLESPPSSGCSANVDPGRQQVMSQALGSLPPT